MMKSLKLWLGACAILAAGAVGAAGSVVEFDTTKTGDGIMWNDLSNWKVGGEQSPDLPSSADAAKFTLNGAELTVNFPESTDITLANLWIYGPGKLTFKMPSTSSIYIPTDNGNSGESAPGSGRNAMAVRSGAIFTLDGGAISNATLTTSSHYNNLQLNGTDTKVFVVNGAKFTFQTRFPCSGNTTPSASTGTGNEIHVSGAGSEMKLSGQISGTSCKVVAENGAKILGVPSVSGSPVDVQFIVTNKATTSALILGSKTTAIFDDTTFANEGLELQPSCSDFTWNIASSTVTLQSLYWGYESCKSCHLNLTNSTVTTYKYHQMGGRITSASSGNVPRPSQDMCITVYKDAVYHAATKSGVSEKSFSLGNYSTNDFFFVDGGMAKIDVNANICDVVSSNSIFKVRGETASAVFAKNLNFKDGSVLACELPLPIDRPVMTCAGQVTLKDNVKYEVTVPKGFSQKSTYTLLASSAKTISGEIAPKNVVVNGKATATVEKSADGKSILLTVKPLSGLMLILR